MQSYIEYEVLRVDIAGFICMIFEWNKAEKDHNSIFPFDRIASDILWRSTLNIK